MARVDLNVRPRGLNLDRSRQFAQKFARRSAGSVRCMPLNMQAHVTVGVSLGTTLAVVCSWQRNRSLLWAILHGIFSWFYVIYFGLTRRASERRLTETPKRDFEAARKEKREAEKSFREFLNADPLAKHLDGAERMRRYVAWKSQTP